MSPANDSTVPQAKSPGLGSSKSKQPAPPKDVESAPLLVNDSDSDYGSEDGKSHGSPSRAHQILLFCHDLGGWFLENMVIVVLTCLLVAGITTVVIYGSEYLSPLYIVF